MSEPGMDLEEELLAAMSSLNMEDTVLDENAMFISDKYVWANHAMKHIRRAWLLAVKAKGGVVQSSDPETQAIFKA